MSVNLSSVMGKVADYANSKEGKAKMKNTIDEYKRGSKDFTAAGSEILNYDRAAGLCYAFIEYLRRIVSSHGLPSNITRHFEDLNYSVIDAGDHFEGYIYFGNEDALSRESLYDERYEGINNIVALFNNGYVASNPVYGWWDGHHPTGDESVFRSGSLSNSAYVRSKQERPALGFMQEAVQEFYEFYKGKYAMVISLDDIYTDGGNFTTLS